MKRTLIVIILILIGLILVVGNMYPNFIYAESPCRIVHIDSCQYILTTQGGITHKANCSNSYHE